MGDSVLLLTKERLDHRVPEIQNAVTMAALGMSVTVATSDASRGLGEYLGRKGIRVVRLMPDRGRGGGVLGTAGRWIHFSLHAWSSIRAARGALIWIGSADTAIALGPGLLKLNFVLQVNELYDAVWRYRKLLKPFARSAACVVVPEPSRGAIMRMWYGLHDDPIVLPNKPIEHPRQRGLALPASVPELPEHSKLLLYQGNVCVHRDIRPVARALAEYGRGWRLAVMGRDSGYASTVRAICPDLVQIPFVPPPEHLLVTSHAYVGLVTYTRQSLNHLFCAPNKVWEYAGFGIPLLCESLPALQTLVEAKGAGVCVDLSRPHCVADALTRLESDYEEYSRRATSLFESVDRAAIVKSALARSLPGSRRSAHEVALSLTGAAT